MSFLKRFKLGLGLYGLQVERGNAMRERGRDSVVRGSRQGSGCS